MRLRLREHGETTGFNAVLQGVGWHTLWRAATNHITDPGYSYDANGNMTNDGANLLGYDAENHMVTAAGWAYVPDGAGLRVRKCTPNCTSPTSNTIYIFNGSQVIAEYDNGAAVGSPTREYIYLGERKLAVYFGSTITYYHADHLSNRRMSNGSGSGTTQLGNFQFGEAWYGTGAKWRFTSYERDTESGNDYAVMRSYINRLGRFSSPDLLGGDISNPQSMNRYQYALNCPTSYKDPIGLCTIIVAGIKTKPPALGTTNQYEELAKKIGGAIVVYPFRGGALIDILSVAVQSTLGPSAGPVRVASTVNSILNDPSGIQIVAHSGGAQAFSTALVSGQINDSASSSINQVVYLSPGLGPLGVLARPSGVNRTIVHGHGPKDFFATFFARITGRAGNPVADKACGHSVSCLYDGLPPDIKNSLTPCPTGQGGSGSGSGRPPSGSTSFTVGTQIGWIGRVWNDGWHDVYGPVPIINPFSIFGNMSDYQPPPWSPARPF